MTTNIRVVNEGPGDVRVIRVNGGVRTEVARLKANEISSLHIASYVYDTQHFVVEEVPAGK